LNCRTLLAVLIGGLALGCSSPLLALTSQEPSGKITTVYVLRHAEKASEPRRDPPLSVAGMQRAEGLAWFMDEVPLSAIYSTRRLRTMQTVAPTARLKGMDVRVASHKNGAALARRILQRHLGRHVLVASHADTIPEILEGLGYDDDVSIGGYGDVLVVSVPERGEVKLQRRHVPAVNNAARLTSLHSSLK
jgi:hypothetical protein